MGPQEQFRGVGIAGRGSDGSPAKIVCAMNAVVRLACTAGFGEINEAATDNIASTVQNCNVANGSFFRLSGFGRIAVSDIEAPNMIVRESGMRWMTGGAKRQRDSVWHEVGERWCKSDNATGADLHG
jgi:hypothetical protein